MPRGFCRINVERLEDRNTPTVAGMPWVDPLHLTLSFAPDGTAVGTSASSLVQNLDSQVPTGSWRVEILRAIQTWAVHANVNVGLVPDSGLALGSGGLVQGDTKFGDIRLAMAPLAADQVAVGTPFQPNGSTWSGDVLLNGSYPFGIASQADYDLFSVVLHEAGHVFGLGEDDDPLSVMYENYLGVRTAVGIEDVSTLQALYGSRQADAFETKQRNETLKSATSLGSLTSPITGDITTLDDVDYYKFSIPGSILSGATLFAQVRTSGISLLVPNLTLYDAFGNVLGMAAANSPLGGDLSLPIRDVVPGGTYYLAVSNATQSVFGIGAYQVALSDQRSATGNGSTSAFKNAENRQNDTLPTATWLTGRNSSGTLLDFSYQASISASADVDYYKVHSQATTDAATLEMIALVSATDLNGLAPRIDVYDRSFKPVVAEVIGNERGFFSVQVVNAVADQDYYVKVSSLAPGSSHATWNYSLGVNFRVEQTVKLESFSSGSLTGANPQLSQSLAVNEASAFHFVLSADAAGVTAGVQVQMSIYDQEGNLVFRLVADAGSPASSGTAYLAAGNYTVRYVGVARSGLLSSILSYSLMGTALSDPIGPMLVGADLSPTTTGSPTTTTDLSTTPLAWDTYWYDSSYPVLPLWGAWIDPYFYY